MKTHAPVIQFAPMMLGKSQLKCLIGSLSTGTMLALQRDVATSGFVSPCSLTQLYPHISHNCILTSRTTISLHLTQHHANHWCGHHYAETVKVQMFDMVPGTIIKMPGLVSMH
ncbi:hypothetical protein PoB_006955800 [Plakobranchus ocellatus]|uniref:Uncharacterized protein n=1 Tax=Plakobranchus ocellatus TaxID=259542 RepID=A0AAV4DFJ5_9GAST|nr:hypothetical protein PoB_006955800 [Plakobranchus ocellatus]